jgi:biotin operon repressor
MAKKRRNYIAEPLLNALKNHPAGGTCDNLAKGLKCSRKAVMNAVHRLKKQGYPIVQANGRGSAYKLKTTSFINTNISYNKLSVDENVAVQSLPPIEQKLWLEFHQKSLMYNFCKDAVVKAYEETDKLKRKLRI